MNRQSRIFVAGADTLIGAAIITALRRDGYDVLDGVGELELRQPSSVTSFFQRHRPECVIVAAGRAAGITGNQRHPAELIHDNLLVVTHVIHEAWASGHAAADVPCQFLQLPEARATTDAPGLTADRALEPTSQSYAVAKLAASRCVQAYRQQHGVEFFAAIPADAFGPGDDFSPEDSHVVAGLMRRMHEAKLRGRRPSTSGAAAGSGVNSSTSDDLASACVFAMQHYAGHGPLNLGGGRDTSIAELAQAIKEVVGFEGELRFDTSKPDGMPLKALDGSELHALGWRPAVSFHDALDRTYRWFLSHAARSDDA